MPFINIARNRVLFGVRVVESLKPCSNKDMFKLWNVPSGENVVLRVRLLSHSSLLGRLHFVPKNKISD